MMRLLRLMRVFRASLWFVPGFIVLGAVLLAISLIQLDLWLVLPNWKSLSLLFGSGAEGSRGMLSAVATSMVTVAGTVFSITLVAFSLASSQYTSRVLRNFMTDTTNQTVLGVFVGIFAYCLIVLRTIRSGDEGAFVPSLAVLGGITLAFVGIAYLIYFIHHISVSIQASYILARVAAETIRAVDHLFPEGVGQADEDSPDAGPRDYTEHGLTWQIIEAPRTGYLQEVDADGLLKVANDLKTVLRMERGVGEFVIEGTPLVSVLADATPSEETVRRLTSKYAVDLQRTPDQDAGYGIRQIVDVALKALSPGINDTTTAMMSLDYLTAIIFRLAHRKITSPSRHTDGTLRLIVQGPTFEKLVAEAFDQIRQNAGGNVLVLRRLFCAYQTINRQTSTPARRAPLRRQLEATWDVVRRTVPTQVDRQMLDDLAGEVQAELDGSLVDD